MFEFLKSKFVGKYKNKTVEELLEAPVSTLKGIDSGAAKILREYDILSIDDFILKWPCHWDWKELEINPRHYTLLICRLRELRKHNYDSGPPFHWENLFDSAPLNYYVTHPSQRFRTEFGPVFYRGRLDGNARVLIVGQDPSTDEILAHRIFVGDGGQKLQRFLNKIGLTQSYIMFNSSLFSIYGSVDTQMKNILREPTIMDYRNKLFDFVVKYNNIEAIFEFGSAAKLCIDNWPGKTNYNNKILHFIHPTAPNDAAAVDWNGKLQTAAGMVQPDGNGIVDLTLYGQTFTTSDSADIPCYDLPFGLPAWHGTGAATHSKRNGAKEIDWTAV